MNPQNLPRIIALTGPARSGKDSAASYMLGMLQSYESAKFAGPLKAMLATGLGLTHEHIEGSDKEKTHPTYDKTPRHIMQTLGTEWGRKLIHEDIWVMALEHSVKDKRAIISDVRFENEAAFARKHGVLIHLERGKKSSSNHESESGVKFKKGDYRITNNSTLYDLYQSLDEVLNQINREFSVGGKFEVDCDFSKFGAL